MAVVITAVLCAGLFAAHQWEHLDFARFQSHTNGFSEMLNLMLDWRDYVPILGIFVLEWLVPVHRRSDSGLTPAAVNDWLWTMLHLIVWAPLIVIVLKGGDWLFTGPLSWFRIDLSGALPNGVLLAIGFLVGELIRWWVHWTFHRVPTLWRFHAVHHSQTELRLWTDFRVHPVEGVLREAVTALPFFLIGGRYSSLVGVLGFAYVWLTPFHHANIRTNLGPLRWVLVTPQSHRVHHSTNPEHYDCNFGNILCIWDRLFRTQSPDDRSYPANGVDGYDIADENDLSPVTVGLNYASRLAEPFRPTSESVG